MEESINYPTVEKQGIAIGHPFKVLKKEPKSIWKTNYAYYLKQKREGAPLRPLLGRKTQEGNFQVYIDGEWQDKNLWDDFSEDAKDEKGDLVLKSNGKAKKQLLFENRFDYLIEFEKPTPITYWNRDSRQTVTEEHKIIWLRVSKNLSEKIKTNVNHPRATSEDCYIINFDNTKSPAEMYSVTLDH